MAQAPADPLAAVLAQFPDNGLPALIASLERACQSPPSVLPPDVCQRLAKLGADAHEALLGCALSSRGQDPGIASAFGDFDARAAWTLPLLIEESNLTKPLVHELLVRLGPAAMPAMPTLQALAEGRYRFLEQVVDRLAKASDQPTPTVPAARQPGAGQSRVDAQHIPALLDRLRTGPEEQRWPALQALLTAGDAAAASAAEVILALELDERTFKASQDLAAALRCTYGARCLQGQQPLDGLLESEPAAEVRRLALAGRLDRLGQVQAWLQSTNPQVRRDSALGLGLLTNGGPIGLSLGLLPKHDDDADGQLLLDLLQRVRRAQGARLAASMLPALTAATTSAEREELLRRLAYHDLRDAPAALWPIVLECATGPDSQQQSPTGNGTSGRTAAGLLYAVARERAGLPTELLKLLPQLGQKENYAQLRTELLDAADATEIAACIRTASERPENLAAWLTLLKASHGDRPKQVVALLGTSLAAEIARLPAAGQLAWLALDRTADVPDATWQELLTDQDVATRRGALQAARWRERTHPMPLDLLETCLRDEDQQVATITGYMLGTDPRDPARATRAIAARFATAPVDLQFNLLLALRYQHEHAGAVRPLIDAAFASTSWHLQLPAALLLLDLEPDHAAAFAALVRLLANNSSEVRQHALRQAANMPAIAARCVDRAIECLDDPNDQVQAAAVRLLGAAPSAKERTLPRLRKLQQERPNSFAGQIAAYAIRTLDEAPTASPDKR
jgi:hypothetical protein